MVGARWSSCSTLGIALDPLGTRVHCTWRRGERSETLDREFVAEVNDEGYSRPDRAAHRWDSMNEPFEGECDPDGGSGRLGFPTEVVWDGG